MPGSLARCCWSGVRTAQLFFNEGQIVEANCGGVKAEKALVKFWISPAAALNSKSRRKALR